MIPQLVLAVLYAYLLAGIPVAFFALVGRLSPVFTLPRQTLVVYWGWFVVIMTASAIALTVLS